MTDRSRNPVSLTIILVAGTLFTLLLLLLAVIGFGIYTGRLAPTAALPQSKILPRQLNEIAKIVSLKPNEKVLYFYSAAMTVNQDGNLFTNDRVISYTNDGGTLQVFDATYDQIEGIDFQPSGSWIDDSTITVTLHDKTTFDLWVSTESNRDKDFYSRIIVEWEKHRQTGNGVTNR